MRAFDFRDGNTGCARGSVGWDSSWLWHENIDVRESVVKLEMGTYGSRVIHCCQEVTRRRTNPTERLSSTRWAFSGMSIFSCKSSGCVNTQDLVRGFHTTNTKNGHRRRCRGRKVLAIVMDVCCMHLPVEFLLAICVHDNSAK